MQIETDHHVIDGGLALVPVKALRFAPTTPSAWLRLVLRLTNRRGQPLSSKAIGMLLRNRLYIGGIDVPDFGVRDQRGDSEPLIAADIFCKAQPSCAKVPLIAPMMRNRPDFPLRGFVRCATWDGGALYPSM